MVLVMLLLNPGGGMAALPERTAPVVTESSVVVIALPIPRFDQAGAAAGWVQIARGWSSRARFGQLCVKFESADAAERSNDSASGARMQSAAGIALSISSQATLADLPHQPARFADVVSAASLAHLAPLLPPPRV